MPELVTNLTAGKNEKRFSRKTWPLGQVTILITLSYNPFIKGYPKCKYVLNTMS